MSNILLCEACYSNAEEIGIIAPGYALVKLDGNFHIFVSPGHRDDIIYTFPCTPTMDPGYSTMKDLDNGLISEADAEDSLKRLGKLSDIWVDLLLDSTYKDLLLSPQAGRGFVNSCEDLGFNANEESFIYWLVNKCGLLVNCYELLNSLAAERRALGLE